MKQNHAALLELPHPTSARHPRMSAANRAAQFAPFAALTGFEDILEDTTRSAVSQAEWEGYQVAVTDEWERDQTTVTDEWEIKESPEIFEKGMDFC